MRITTILAISTLLAFGAPMANALTTQQAVEQCLQQYLPGVTGFGAVSVKSVKINDSRRTVTVNCNDNTAYIPFTGESLAALKADIAKVLGPKYKDYKIQLLAGKEARSLDDLALFAPKKNLGPTETDRFVVREDAQAAPAGLDGANIALWQSHGWYFEPKLNRWEFQRARVMQTVEDLYTQSYVMPFLMPMLENAGAYVMSPRERDINLNEVIIDNDGLLAGGAYTESALWTDSSTPGFAYTSTELHNDQFPFTEGTARISDSKEAKAAWSAEIPQAGTYAVYVSYTTEPNSTKKARYTVNAADGAHHFTVNQKMGGGTWIYLGHFPFAKGQAVLPIVEVANAGTDGTVLSADAVKVGGGMGNVARIVKEPLDSIDYEYVLSARPRFTEAARYFLQWAGAPDSVYTPSGNINDYGDDYKCRGLWVNWLSGGSSMNPSQRGLNIPVDLSLAFHTDAGTTLNDSIIGTLGIYCTMGDTLGNGSSRLASRDYTDLMMTNIVNDVRAAFEPNWSRRGMWDDSYYEARVPAVPAILLELLSHQNFADMKYGLDPTFRFTVSRAIYKGMLKFLAKRDGREYVVQPLPVRAFAISHPTNDEYTLTWAETVDKQEPTASPAYYLVQERIDDGTFQTVARVEAPNYTVNVTDDKIHSYRIIAGNDGGVSFPSEVLALCNLPRTKTEVMIVNGFTRVSAPDWFDSGEIAGFYDAHDYGVPYIHDISFIGSQFEFRREIPWMDDDASGFGASRANYEDKVIAGNTFDYVYTHGCAIRDCGHGFISSSVEAYMADESASSPLIVDLILGKQKETKRGTGAYGTDSKTFPEALQARLREHTGRGGSIFASGAYVASDLWDNPYSTPEQKKVDQDFAKEVLGYIWRVDQASVTGEAYQVPTRFKSFGKGEYTFSAQLNEDMYVVESPDSMYPADDKTGATFMRYSENNLIAGTAMRRTDYQTVVLGFPFETIYGRDARLHLMKQVLEFLSGK